MECIFYIAKVTLRFHKLQYRIAQYPSDTEAKILKNIRPYMLDYKCIIRHLNSWPDLSKSAALPVALTEVLA